MTPLAVSTFVLGFVVIVVVAAFVAAPLFGPAERDAAAGAGEREIWERRKRQALAAIKEAELDHRMGKLSAEDLGVLRSRFEAQALEAMAALEREARP